MEATPPAALQAVASDTCEHCAKDLTGQNLPNRKKHVDKCNNAAAEKAAAAKPKTKGTLLSFFSRVPVAAAQAAAPAEVR